MTTTAVGGILQNTPLASSGWPWVQRARQAAMRVERAVEALRPVPERAAFQEAVYLAVHACIPDAYLASAGRWFGALTCSALVPEAFSARARSGPNRLRTVCQCRIVYQ